MTERKYPSWTSEAMTFDEMVEELGGYIAHLLLKTTPHEFVSDAKQEALLRLWELLQDNPNWIADHHFRAKGGLARRLAYDGRQRHGAWGPVQRLYEQRVVNEATMNDWLELDPEGDPCMVIGDRLSSGNTDFWRDLSEIEPRNLEVILYPDGYHHDWRDLADMRFRSHGGHPTRLSPNPSRVARTYTVGDRSAWCMGSR